MNRGPGPGRGRGLGNFRGNSSPAGGPQFTGSGDQPPRRNKPGQSSRGRKNRSIYVAKHQEEHASSEAMVDGPDETKHVIASDSTHKETGPPLSMLEPGQKPGQSSRGRKNRSIYVAKHREEHASSEAMVDGPEETKHVIASDSTHKETGPPLSAPHGSALHVGEEGTQIELTPAEVMGAGAKSTVEFSNKSNLSWQHVESSLRFKYGDKDGPSPIKGPKTPVSDRKTESFEPSAAFVPFDICPPKTSVVVLKPSLLVKNRERRNETKRIVVEGQNGSVLRSGMVILKSYISISDQVKIVKRCRDLGLGPGGFYQPGYRDGAKLHLNMMCLGKNWDPETSQYGDHRPTDGAKPPIIPNEFYKLVKEAIKDAHFLIGKEPKAGNVEKLLPWMTPNICLVNFYSSNGRLGLHQDRDESPESIRKGLPVVSFSIGDTAEFLYGDQRDVEKADMVLLESGDVLIFGGESRNVFHGVKTIRPNTAPKTLLEETNLHTGRVNLTFRQY